MQLPSSSDVTAPNHHVQLARDAGFRAAVLRSCANLLEQVQSEAATSALLQDDAAAADAKGSEPPAGAAAGAASEVLELGPALFKVARVGLSSLAAACCGVGGGNAGLR